MDRPLVIIAGPTATGKSAVSVDLAKKINGEIISADSMQVYKYMDIGSAKITPEETGGVKHYLTDILDPKESFNVVEFQKLAKEALGDIYKAGHIPIVVGGTGFYIQALLYDIDFTETDEDESYRKELAGIAEREGPEALHKMLEEVDAEAAEKIHPNNIKRTIRALEFHKKTGGRISEHNAAEREKTSPYNFAYYVLTMDRQLLYKRIDERVDKMFDDGLVDEVRNLKDMGCRKDSVSMQGLGYKEVFDYLDGEVSLEDTKRIIKRDTRHFAKRQITWFKREKDVVRIDKGEFGFDDARVAAFIAEDLKERGIISF